MAGDHIVFCDRKGAEAYICELPCPRCDLQLGDSLYNPGLRERARNHPNNSSRVANVSDLENVFANARECPVTSRGDHISDKQASTQSTRYVCEHVTVNVKLDPLGHRYTTHHK